MSQKKDKIKILSTESFCFERMRSFTVCWISGVKNRVCRNKNPTRHVPKKLPIQIIPKSKRYRGLFSNTYPTFPVNKEN